MLAIIVYFIVLVLELILAIPYLVKFLKFLRDPNTPKDKTALLELFAKKLGANTKDQNPVSEPAQTYFQLKN